MGGCRWRTCFNLFGIIQQSTGPGIPIRTVNRSYSLRNFGVRFVSAHNFSPLPFCSPSSRADSLDSNLANMVRLKTPAGKATRIQTERDLSRLGAKREDSAPWWTQARSVLYSSTNRVQQFSMMDQPILLLFVATTGEHPAAFEQISAMSNLPLCLQRQQYSTDIPRFFVTLHSPTDAPEVDPSERLRAMQIRYGAPSVRMLVVNSCSRAVGTSFSQTCGQAASSSCAALNFQKIQSWTKRRRQCSVDIFLRKI